MGKYKIEVEIPDGKYCEDDDNDIWCDYMSDNHYYAAGCSLIKHKDSGVNYEKGHDPESACKSIDNHTQRIRIRILKHKDCPSLVNKTENDTILQ